MNLSLTLFLIATLGFVSNRKNGIFPFIIVIIVLSLNFYCISDKVYAIAGAESAIGLGILVAFYRLRGSIAIDFK